MHSDHEADQLTKDSGDTTIQSFRTEPWVADLGSAIRPLLPMLASLTGKGIILRFDLEECPVGMVFIHHAELIRILVILVRHSAQAIAGRGEIVLTATSLYEREDRQEAVLVSITDDGPGIPLTELEDIFRTEPSAMSPHDAGLSRGRSRLEGSGLKMVRDIMEIHGGFVRAFRLPSGRGSKIEFCLPMSGSARSNESK